MATQRRGGELLAMALPYTTLLKDYPCTIFRVRCHDCGHAEDHRLMALVRIHGFDLTVGDMLTILLDECPQMHFEPGGPGMPCGGWLPDLYKEHVCGRPERGGKLRVIK